MSEICLGTMWFGTRTDEETSFELLDRSIEAGGRVERARNLAGGRPAFTNLQLRHSYLRPRLDVREPGDHAFADASDEVLDYVRAEPAMRLWAYSPLLKGGYSGKPLDGVYDHPGTPARLAALHAVAEEAGATPNQVVIAWLLAHDVVPVVGVSSLAQLEETLAARDLKLDEPAVRRLDGVTGL